VLTEEHGVPMGAANRQATSRDMQLVRATIEGIVVA
jgi:hypothetical protein